MLFDLPHKQWDRENAGGSSACAAAATHFQHGAITPRTPGVTSATKNAERFSSMGENEKSPATGSWVSNERDVQPGVEGTLCGRMETTLRQFRVPY